MSKAREFKSFIQGLEQGADRNVDARFYASHFAKGMKGGLANQNALLGHWWRFMDGSQLWISKNGNELGKVKDTPVNALPGRDW